MDLIGTISGSLMEGFLPAGWNLKKRAPAPFDTSINYEYKHAMLRA